MIMGTDLRAQTARFIKKAASKGLSFGMDP